MSDATVDLFAEDRAHEELLHALVRRLACEHAKNVVVRVRSARGGHPRAFGELRLFQKAVVRGYTTSPAILVVCIDANCKPFAKANAEIRKAIVPALSHCAVVACPDPHVERWYLADPTSFEEVVGRWPHPGKRKCQRGLYKEILAKAVREGGNPPTLGGIEFAGEIVDRMDLFRAGKNEPSLKRFVAELSLRIKALP